MELLSPGSIGPRAEQDRRDRAARTAEEAAGAHKVEPRRLARVRDGYVVCRAGGARA